MRAAMAVCSVAQQMVALAVAVQAARMELALLAARAVRQEIHTLAAVAVVLVAAPLVKRAFPVPLAARAAITHLGLAAV
tara:strand:+ start:584 stop:820 length:237 start_codon:yes stop_codon:yes gene_type:complete